MTGQLTGHREPIYFFDKFRARKKSRIISIPGIIIHMYTLKDGSLIPDIRQRSGLLIAVSRKAELFDKRIGQFLDKFRAIVVSLGNIPADSGNLDFVRIMFLIQIHI